MEKGTVYFFTGLAGAGKTTIGGLFYERLKEISPDAELIDGDRVRSGGSNQPNPNVMNEDRYTTEARKSGAWGMFARCRDIAEQGRDVVVCSISMYKEIRDWNRANIQHYREIYVKASMDTLYRRDQKRLYSSKAKNVVGVDLPWDEPDSPDVVVENDGDESPEEIVENLVELFLQKEPKHEHSRPAYAQHRV